MPKKKALISVRQLFWLGSKLVISLLILLCFFSLLRLHPSSRPRRSRTVVHFEGPPKIAFLFLARKDLPLDFLWRNFFENAESPNFSIYIHSEPSFVFDKTTSRSPSFYGRQLRNSIKVIWGESSMIEAERLLFDEALQDPANQRFVLLSESCVPLYNFSYIYNYLMSSPRSFVESFVDVNNERYNPEMKSVIPEDKWQKGSQWITLVRKHAEIVVDDDLVLPVFKRYCKRRPTLDLRKGLQSLKLQEQHNCIPDEHYVQTLLAMTELQGELEKRTLTYSLWNHSKSKMDSKGWHPITFDYPNAGRQRIQDIKDINNVYYPSEFRTEWCRINTTYVNCFLFARKFTRHAALRLLSERLLGTFDYTVLLDTPS